MQAFPARRVRKAIPVRKVRQVIPAGRLDLKALPAMMGRKVHKDCPAFKALREMMAQPALKVRKESPVQMDKPDPKARKACRVIPVVRQVLKARQEMTVRPVLKARPAR